MKTHYDVLGVPSDADYETIKAAYRKALKKHHPDLTDGSGAAELRSKRIIDAHAVLRDPGQRARYDQTLKHRRQQRRRLFIIIALLTACIVCIGSLLAIGVMINRI
jgi:curved DNA-binding protein CbpA